MKQPPVTISTSRLARRLRTKAGHLAEKGHLVDACWIMDLVRAIEEYRQKAVAPR